MRIAGYRETLHPLAFTWDCALADIMCDIKLDIHGTFHGNAIRGNAITRTWLHLCVDAMLLSQIQPSTNTAHQDFRQTRNSFFIVLALPSQNMQFFLVSVRYPCVSLTRFLVDVAAIIE